MQKFGFKLAPRPNGKLLWINAASVGEVNSAVNLLKVINNELNYKIVFTTTTLTSYKIIKEKLPFVIHNFAPIDIYFIIKKFLKHFKPDKIIFIDSEIWPNLVTESSKFGDMMLLNARISEKSYKQWLKFSNIFKEILSSFKIIYTQSMTEKKYFDAINIKNYFITNLKFSSILTENSNINDKKFFESFSGKKILIIASTHNGEEEIILSSIKNIINNPEILIIIAPRHPIRVNQVKNICEKYGQKIIELSKSEEITYDTKFLIIDVIGHLVNFYNLANIAIIGNSFIENMGGHNPIEASNGNCAIMTGKYHKNFKDIYNLYIKNSAVKIIELKDIENEINNLFNDEDNLKLIAQNALTLAKNEVKKIEYLFDEVKNFLKTNL